MPARAARDHRRPQSPARPSLAACALRVSGRRRPGSLHTEGDAAVVGPSEIAVARDSPEREELRIAVVAKVEDAREPAARVTLLGPSPVWRLGGDQVVNAARNGRMIHLARGHQSY